MIALASDHAGFALKQAVAQHLKENGVEFKDCGTHSADSCDYPDFARLGCAEVVEGRAECAILICGTGVGISIAANKVKGIRAACCSDVFSAKYCRIHNNANALCFGARVVGEGMAFELVDAYLGAEFEGGRHQRRIDKIMQIERED